jgi:hypothetical protein
VRRNIEIKMKQVDVFKQKIKELDPYKPFGLEDFGVVPAWYNHLTVFLNREQKAGNIGRFAKGLYYIPRIGIISGEPISPSCASLFDVILKRDKGYPTGISIYNQFRLSTQWTPCLIYATNKVAKTFTIEIAKFVRVKSHVPDNEITPENIPFLQMLDCILNIEIIPDTTADDAVVIIKSYMKRNYSREDFEKIETLSYYYPPRVRALLGAIIEGVSPKLKPISRKIRKSLNPATKFRFSLISKRQLPKMNHFNIFEIKYA